MQHLLWKSAIMSEKRTPVTPPSLRLTQIDDEILHAASKYYYLTAEHITRLFFSRGSLKHVKAKAKLLADNEYLQRLYFVEKKPGKARHVFHIGTRGIQYLQSISRLDAVRYRPSEQEQRSDYFLAHTLACNDVFIAAELLHRQVPAIRLKQWVHERSLRRTPVRVTLSLGAGGQAVRRTVIPDGWLDFRISEHDGSVSQACVILELDRDQEEQQRWRHKVAELVAYTTRPGLAAPSPYEAAFGTDVATIAVVVAPRDPRVAARRCLELRTWTEKELEHLGATDRADDFRFTAEPPTTDPQRLFLEPCWSRPFSIQPLPLLEHE